MERRDALTYSRVNQREPMRRFAFAFALLLLGFTGTARAEPQWLTLPPTPTLPTAAQSGLAPVNGIKLWYAEFGHGAPVILLHGGLANSNYWGLLVRALAPHYRVIVMDSRGHGRSSRDARPYGYDLMADDVVGLMDYLKIDKAALVGWSDGAIIGLDIALHHPQRLSKLFAFAANSDPSAVKDVEHDPVFSAFIARARREYETLSPTPTEYDAFLNQIDKMWEDAAALDRRPTARHQGADLDRRRRSRRSDQARQHTVHGRQHSRQRPSDPAAGQSLLVSAGPGTVQRRRAAFFAASAGEMRRSLRCDVHVICT